MDRLFNARPAIVDDIISGETIASMTSGRPASGDGFHILIMDLNKEINRLQSEISTEVIEGAKAYGVTYEAAVAEFIHREGITRCPTVCLAPTQGSVAGTDQLALQRRAEQLEECGGKSCAMPGTVRFFAA